MKERYTYQYREALHDWLVLDTKFIGAAQLVCHCPSEWDASMVADRLNMQDAEIERLKKVVLPIDMQRPSGGWTVTPITNAEDGPRGLAR